METTITARLEQFTQSLADGAMLGAAVAAQEVILPGQEAKVLTRILADLHPIMRSIDTPIRAAGHCPGGPLSHWAYTNLPEHGIVLAGGMEATCETDPHQGAYDGHDLMLARSGILSYRTFTGYWSQGRDEPEYWDTDSTMITAADALTHYPFDTILDGILTAVTGAMEKAASKQRTLATRLERLQAVKAALR